MVAQIGIQRRAMTDFARLFVVSLLLILLTSSAAPAALELEPRGHQFIWFDSFEAFTNGLAEKPRETVLSLPMIASRIDFNQLIVSWNAALPKDGCLKVQAKALY